MEYAPLCLNVSQEWPMKASLDSDSGVRVLLNWADLFRQFDVAGLPAFLIFDIGMFA